MSTSDLAAAISLSIRVVGFDAETLAARDLDEGTGLIFVGDGVAEIDRAARSQRDLRIGEMSVVIGGLRKTHAAQGGYDIILRIGLRGVDDVVNSVCLGEDGMSYIVGL